MFGMGHWEILIIFLVILLIFGAKRIPEMAQGLGKGISEFRRAIRDAQEEIDVGNSSHSSNPIETSTPKQSVPHEPSSDSAHGSNATTETPKT